MTPASRTTTRILPALVLALMAVLPAYVGSLWTGVAKLAWAEEAAVPATESATPEPASESAATPPSAADAAGAPAAHDTAAGGSPPEAAASAAEAFDPLTLTKAEIDVLRQLAKRRDELTARERELEDREAMLRATEQRIAEQVRQMQQMKADYQQMRTQRDEAAEASLRRLVTVYEAMKPDEAARIFETMEGAVLLDVVMRMGERRLAPILAQMSPARAQALTVAMASRRAVLPAVQNGG
jgi:flagellar motility protein MotE (MotC chaperone)